MSFLNKGHAIYAPQCPTVLKHWISYESKIIYCVSRLTDAIQVREIGLEDRILMTSKNSIAAQNRFIYYPDHLVRMPGPGSSFLQTTKPQRPGHLQDESVGSFLTRRFGSALADNVVSAIFHGIYAGDIYKLSARAIVPSLWATEIRNQSIIKGLLEQAFGRMQPIAKSDLDTIRTLQSWKPLRNLAFSRSKVVLANWLTGWRQSSMKVIMS